MKTPGFIYQLKALLFYQVRSGFYAIRCRSHKEQYEQDRFSQCRNGSQWAPAISVASSVSAHVIWLKIPYISNTPPFTAIKSTTVRHIQPYRAYVGHKNAGLGAWATICMGTYKARHSAPQRRRDKFIIVIFLGECRGISCTHNKGCLV
jgi:hypothetical protein